MHSRTMEPKEKEITNWFFGSVHKPPQSKRTKATKGVFCESECDDLCTETELVEKRKRILFKIARDFRPYILPPKKDILDFRIQGNNEIMYVCVSLYRNCDIYEVRCSSRTKELTEEQLLKAIKMFVAS